MKKVLLLSMSLLTVVACKKNIDNGNNGEGQGEGQEMLIELGVGGPMSRAANIGVRDTLFEVGDQIGVTSMYGEVATPFAVKFDTLAQFVNAPAIFSENLPLEAAISNSKSVFLWGPGPINDPVNVGGLTWNRYYPAKKRGVYFFAYYPYSSTDFIVPDGTATHPMLKIALQDGGIGMAVPDKADVNLLQPDVLWYAGSLVSSAAKSGTLQFNHALAQVRFTLKRPEGAGICYFDTLEFRTVKKGSIDLTNGAFTLATSVGKQEAIYKIASPDSVNKKSRQTYEIPEWTGSDPKDKVLDILNIASVAYKPNYLMVIPLSQPDAALGYLRIVCDFSKTGDGTERMSINVPLENVKAFEAGKLNTLEISVSRHQIGLEAKITKWGVGTQSDLVAE